MAMTPEQFNQLVTKNDFQEVKTDVQDIKADLRTLLSAVDGLAKKVDNISSEFVSNQVAHDRFEVRISTLEKSSVEL